MERFRIVYSTPDGEPGEVIHEGRESELPRVIERIEDMGILHAVSSLGPAEEEPEQEPEGEGEEPEEEPEGEGEEPEEEPEGEGEEPEPEEEA